MKKHILLIDDDKDELTIFLDALRHVPSDDGFKCTYAQSTLQAVHMLKFLVPDYIFIDYNIPKMNGIEFIDFIRQQPTLRKTKLCLYSTRISGEMNEAATAMGASCIEKSNTIDELTRALERLFGQVYVSAGRSIYYR